MNKTLLAILVVFGLSADGARAAIVMIDDFAAPNPAAVFLINFDHDNSTPIEQGELISTVGSERDVVVTVQGEASVQSAQLLIGHDGDLFNQGILQLATARNPGSMATLQYDGADVDGDALINSRGLNVDLTDGGVNTDFVIEFLTIDAPFAAGLDLQIRLTSLAGGSAVFNGVAPESVVPSAVFAAFSSFLTEGSFSFAAIDSIEIELNGPAVADVDFEINDIYTVPEPGTIALLILGLGAAGLLLRRAV